MDKQNISVYFIGLLPIGFSTFPGQNAYKFEHLNLNKPYGQVDSNYSVKDNRTLITYIAHGLIGESNLNEPRSGRNFGIVIEIEGYKLSDRDGLFSFLKSIYDKAILDDTKGIFRPKSNPPFYNIYKFDDKKDYFTDIGNSIQQQFFAKFRSSFKKCEPGDNSYINLNKSVAPAKEIVKMIPPKVVEEIDDLEEVKFEIKPSSKKSTTQEKFNTGILLTCLLLLMSNGYTIYQLHKLNSLMPKGVSYKPSVAKTIDPVEGENILPKIDANNLVISKTNKDGKTTAYLNKALMIQYFKTNKTNVKSQDEVLSKIVDILMLNLTIQDKYKNKQELIKYLTKKNNVSCTRIKKVFEVNKNKPIDIGIAISPISTEFELYN